MSILPKFDPFSETQNPESDPAKIAKVAKVRPETPPSTERLAGLATLADANTKIDDFEERAAIIEYDAGVPREWAEGFARLCTMSRPAGYPEARWQTLIDDAGKFMDRWAVQVSSMGWSVGEVFGVHPDAPDARIDLKGLVLCIGGTEVVAVSADSVTVQTPSGARQRIFRRADKHSAGRITVWELKQEIEQ